MATKTNSNPAPEDPDEEVRAFDAALRASLRVPTPQQDRKPFWNLDAGQGGGDPNVPDPPWGAEPDLAAALDHLGGVLIDGSTVAAGTQRGTFSATPTKG